MKRTSLICTLIAVLTTAAMSHVTAQTTFFSDSFDRPDNLDLDGSVTGMSGILLSAGVLTVSNTWLEPVDAANTEADSQVLGSQLQMGGNGHADYITLNRNFGNIISNGTISVSLDLVSGPTGATPLTRHLGIGVGFTLAEGTVNTDRELLRAADLFVAETANGLIRINDENPTNRPSAGDVAPTTTIDLDSGAAVFVAGTLRLDMTITNMGVGSTVVYSVLFNSGSGFTTLTTRSFILTDDYQFYTGIDERSAAATVTDNFSISASSYTLPPLDTLTWRATTDNNWDTTTTNWVDFPLGTAGYAFSSGLNVRFDDTASSSSIAIPSTVLPGNIVVNNSSLNYTFSGAGSIGGSGSLTKSGGGLLTVNLNNGYTGGTTLAGGRVRVVSAGALGGGLLTLSGGTISSIGSAALTVTNKFAVSSASGFGDATDNGTLTFSSVLDLSGAIRTMTVNPNSTAIFTGGVTNGNIGSKQGSGTLIVRGGLAEVTGSSDAQDGTLMFDGVTVHSTDRVIADAGGVNGIGRLVITNGASVTVSNSVGNLRAGRVASAGSNYVDLAGLYYLPNADGNNGNLTLEGDAAYSEVTFWPGGDFAARSVTNNGSVVGNTVFKFNGGILHARNDNPNFFEGLAHAYVQSGGALIDDGGFAVTMNQGLETDGSGGGLTKLGAGTLILAGNNTYTGNTIVSNGTLIVTSSGFTGGGNVMVEDGAGFGVTNSGGSLSLSALTLGTSGATTLKFHLPNGNGGPTISASSVAVNGPVAINIAGNMLKPGTFTLIQSSSSISGLGNFHLGTVQPGVYATLVTSPTSVSLNITNVVNTLEWTGGTDNNWDTTTINWTDLNTGNPTNYSELTVGDAVVFDSFVTYVDVNLATTVKPVSMAVDQYTTYSFTGPGMISGIGKLLVDNYSTATFGTMNSYSGGTLLNSGNIYVGADGALGSGPVTINLGGVLASDSATPHTLTNTFIQISDTAVTFGESGSGLLTLGKLDLDGGPTRTLETQSDVAFTGGITNGAFTVKTGTGNLIVKGDSSQTALVNHQEGDVVIDGARFDNGNGWRVACDKPGYTSRLIVTNGGVFTITTVSANLKIGQSGISGDNGASTTNLLDVSGTVNMTPSGSLGGNSAVVLGQSGGVCVFNLRPNGNVLARAVTGGSPAITEAHFYGGKLTAIGDQSAFIIGLTNAYMENGGLTIDTTNYTVTVPQDLLASGSGGLTKEGSGILTLTGANTYTGNTVVNAGKLALGDANTLSGAIIVNANSTLTFLQTSITNRAGVGGVTIGDGTNSVLEANLVATNAPAGMITNLVLNGAVAVNVAGPLKVGQIPLFGYGTISGPGHLTLGLLPLGDVGHLVTNTVNKTIDLVVDSVALTIWTGAVNINWDTTTTNWTVLNSLTTYQQLANVSFDDSASNSTVNLTTTLTPSSVVISNNALAYNLSGSGSLGGFMSLTKNGTNSLDMSTANTFTGDINIKGGSFRVGTGSPLGSSANNVYVTSGGTLDIRGNNLGSQPISAVGNGYDGNGAVVNTAGDQNDALTTLILTGDATVGGTGVLGVRTGADTDPGLVASGHKLTKMGSGSLNLNGGKTVAGLTNAWFTDIGDIHIQQGTISFQRRAALGNPTNTITVESGAALDVFSLNQDLTVPTNRIVLNNGALEGTGVLGNTNTLGGQITLNSSNNAINVTQWAGAAGPTLLYLNGPIVGAGSVTYTTLTNAGVNGLIRLAGNNTYSGNTVVANGTLMLTSGNALGGTPSIMVNSNATLDVTTIAPWILGAGQTLGGSGNVTGDVVANGTLAPGSSVGALTVNGNLTVSGNLAIEVDKSLSQSNDIIVVSGSLNNTSSGTLIVSNLNSLAPLAVGDKFTVFNQQVNGGGTLNVVGAGATWINNLAVDGSIQVSTVASNPQIGKVTASGGNLTMTGSGGSPGGTYYVITATNVATPVLNWVPVSTNTFAADGNFTNTLSITPGEAKRFYRLKTP